jgi:hypothetical protein
MAGYHAAEHQVVHAIERGEPLTVAVVRQMPRVHPRCGTNLVAGVFLATLIGVVLQPVLGSMGYLVGGGVALGVWRDVGAWFQQYLTTKPAKDREIESGINAARDVLEKYSDHPGIIAPPAFRIWNMGIIPLIIGFLIGCLLIYALSWWLPFLKDPLRSYLIGW